MLEESQQYPVTYVVLTILLNSCMEQLYALVPGIHFLAFICLLVVGIYSVCFLLSLLWPESANCCERVDDSYMWSPSALCMPQGPGERMSMGGGQKKKALQICKSSLIKNPTTPKAVPDNQNQVVSLTPNNQIQPKIPMMSKVNKQMSRAMFCSAHLERHHLDWLSD